MPPRKTPTPTVPANGHQEGAGPEVINAVSNDGEFTVDFSIPYVARVILEGTAPILFHRWSCDDVEAKSNAAKGSAAKKTDNLEAYIYRAEVDSNGKEVGDICIPGEYLRGAIVNAAKYRQDPRSPRKSAMDMFKAGVVPLTELASLGTTDWDYVDRRRVVIQRSAVTRQRPAMNPGWRAEFELLVNLPNYINPMLLKAVIDDAGKLVGLADFRPTYGRFTVVRYDILTGDEID